MTIRYHSTRGEGESLSLAEVVLAGLAPDGGLYVPDSLPRFSPAELTAMQRMDYVTLAAEVLWPFFESSEFGVQSSEGREPPSSFEAGGQNASIFESKAELHAMLAESYATFRHPAIAPLKQLGANEWLLELFQGPTLAFKDFALQFLGRLLDRLLARRGDMVTILGATSGDTGSAAIAGCRGRAHMNIVILHPHERVSPIQRRQMTTVADANVLNLAVRGSFDDCQDIVKTLFTDAEMRAGRQLTAVNSINWARIMAQIVYYFYAALALGAPAKAVSFSVPTGNFGDIYAGYLARRMGLPIAQLIVATNRNDILSRCINEGGYHQRGVEPSLSPSMDIQISSNFERLLYDLHGGDTAAIRELMQQIKTKKGFDLPPLPLARLRNLFAAARCDDEQTAATIADMYHATGEMLDPHSAVGLFAGRACWDGKEPMVVLGTAHPAKFPDAVIGAIGVDPVLPGPLQGLHALEERFTVIDPSPEAVKKAIDAYFPIMTDHV